MQGPTEEETGGNASLGAFALAHIQQQLTLIREHEQGILHPQEQNYDSQHVHQARVANRRLQAIVTLCAPALDLPASCSAKHIKHGVRILGTLRDLDVQLMHLQHPEPDAGHAETPTPPAKLLKKLQKKQRKARAAVREELASKHHQRMCRKFEKWLAHPRYRAEGNFPLHAAIPELLLPSLAQFMLHPAWLLDTETLDAKAQAQRHDLRKKGKQVRYQFEFLSDYYRGAADEWISTLKSVQDTLGALQDAYTFIALIDEQAYPAYNQKLTAEREQALSNWDTLRKTLFAPGYRQALYQWIVANPTP